MTRIPDVTSYYFLFNRIAAIESLISGLIVGVTYGFLSGQPLTILGSTGPILVFETIMFDFCKSVGFQYLPFRFWYAIQSCHDTVLMFAT